MLFLVPKECQKQHAAVLHKLLKSCKVLGHGPRAALSSLREVFTEGGRARVPSLRESRMFYLRKVLGHKPRAASFTRR